MSRLSHCPGFRIEKCTTVIMKKENEKEQTERKELPNDECIKITREKEKQQIPENI